MRVELLESLASIAPDQWNALTGPDDPFVEYAFLRGLETSGSVGGESGWHPLHVAIWRDGTLIGALPLYAKLHSYGEYIFDFAWARAAQQMGIRYFPKLVAMVPCTSATGRRFLVHPSEDEDEITGYLLAGTKAAADHIEASSIHLLFLTEKEKERAIAHDFRPRTSMQFHWENEAYTSFDDFLSKFRSRKRKQVRKERRSIEGSDLQIQLVRGPNLSGDDWQAIDRFYRDTCRRHFGSQPYLTPTFFSEIGHTHAERILVAMAKRNGQPVAASLNFQKGNHLYGRYWGGDSPESFLHFELCYYRLIEYAITHQIQHFEAGAQGTQKLLRGMLPVPIHSAHWIRHPHLDLAVANYLPEESAEIHREIAWLKEQSPFHRDEKSKICK